MKEIIYQRERFSEAWHEMRPIAEANHEALNLFGHDLEMDFETYCQLDEDGGFKLFTMRCDGVLVGYCAFVLYRHPHHISHIHACQDALHVNKPYRGKAAGFIGYCDEQLRKTGVSVVLQHSLAKKDWGKVLEWIGYTKLETTYFRRL